MLPMQQPIVLVDEDATVMMKIGAVGMDLEDSNRSNRPMLIKLPNQMLLGTPHRAP